MASLFSCPPRQSSPPLLLIGVIVWAVQRDQTTTTQTSAKLIGQPFLGKADAPVTVVAFEDFKCPVCKNFEENDLPQLKAKYLDTGKAKFYLLNFPFLAQKFPLDPDDSQLVAQAAKCTYDQAGNDGYFGMAAILFRAQGNETEVWATKDKLEELAGSVDGVDPAKFKTCLNSDATKASVDADEKQGNDAEINGTPSAFVNGVLIPGVPTAESVSKAIDAALAKK